MRRTRRTKRRRSSRRKNNKCWDFVPLYENIKSHSYFEKNMEIPGGHEFERQQARVYGRIQREEREV